MTVKEALALGPIALTKHGRCKSRTYRIWQHMKRRCFCISAHEYPNYGGRGITICAGWKNDFISFLKDMGECPPNHSIERINNNGNYCPSNCKWATPAEQALNKRTNRILTINGVSMTAKEWADRSAINPHTLITRLSKGWSIERALSQKVGKPRGISV